MSKDVNSKPLEWLESNANWILSRVCNAGRFNPDRMYSPYSALLDARLFVENQTTPNSSGMFMESQWMQIVGKLMNRCGEVDACIAGVDDLSLDFKEFDGFMLCALATCSHTLCMLADMGYEAGRVSRGSALTSNIAWRRFSLALTGYVTGTISLSSACKASKAVALSKPQECAFMDAVLVSIGQHEMLRNESTNTQRRTRYEHQNQVSRGQLQASQRQYAGA